MYGGPGIRGKGGGVGSFSDRGGDRVGVGITSGSGTEIAGGSAGCAVSLASSRVGAGLLRSPGSAVGTSCDSAMLTSEGAGYAGV